MTLLAAVADGERSFLVSDILQTKDGEIIQHVPYAIFPVGQVLTEEFWRSAIDPVQKSYVINDSLCVGVAGNYFTGKAIILELNEHFKSQTINIGQLSDFLCSGIVFGRASAVMVGLVKSGADIVAFRYQSDTQVFQTGVEFFEGSGGPFLKEHLNAPATRGMREIQVPGGISVNRHSPLILHEITEILFLQHTEGRYLINEFGGGFQIVVPTDTSFEFVDNYLMMGCIASLEENGFRLDLGQSAVLQRHIDGRFAVAACPIQAETTVAPPRVRLLTDRSTVNTAEQWLRPP